MGGLGTGRPHTTGRHALTGVREELPGLDRPNHVSQNRLSRQPHWAGASGRLWLRFSVGPLKAERASWARGICHR